MKKFTKIDEELLKESQSAQEMFNSLIDEIENKLNQFNIELNKYKAEYYSDPNGRTKDNWGYIGSLKFVNEQLDNILEHLNN